MTVPGITARHPAWWVATWFGAGLLPKIPGTWGSIAALPFAWVIAEAWGGRGLLIAAAAATVAGIWAAGVFCDRSGDNDPQTVVIDEVAGQWLTLSAGALTFGDFVLGFLLFRLFDIWKPWPANWADRNLHGGWGVMLDDVAAGGYAAICLLVIRYLVG